MEMTFVVSSNIDAVAHHSNDLIVRFKNGSAYRYLNCPRTHFDALIKAESAGKYLNEVIKKGGYAYERLAFDPLQEPHHVV